MNNLAAHADVVPCGLRHCGRIAFAGSDAQKHGSLEALHLGNVGSAMVARWPVSKAVRGRHMTLRLPGDLVVPLKVRLCALRKFLLAYVGAATVCANLQTVCKWTPRPRRWRTWPPCWRPVARLPCTLLLAWARVGIILFCD